MENNYLKEVRVRLCLNDAGYEYSSKPMDSPSAAIEVMADIMKALDRETVCVVNLDNHLKPINYNVVAIGSLTGAQVELSNIFKSSILSNADSLILLHNHPSGAIEPSSADRRMTRAAVAAGNLLGIKMADHIIVGGGNGDFYSFRRQAPELFDDYVDLDYLEDLFGKKELTSDVSFDISM